jgi:hypothetical protein
MADKRPVVVYGVSGYTGRLVCEYLREYNVPFIAAGRDAGRVKEVVEKIPGIETADYEVVGVEHNVEALTELFKGASVVSNMVGPFIKYGGEVVEACSRAGCHYLDTTGEQDWVLEAKTKWSQKFADKGLLLSPGVAQMYTTGEIAAQICLETPGVDTLDILVLWSGFPTTASTQTIFTILKAKWYYLEQKQYKEWPLNQTFEVNVPGQHSTALALPWGGTSHPVWFKDDPRVANVKVAAGVFAREVMQGVVATVKMYEDNITPLPMDPEQYAASRKSAAQQISRLGPCVGAARPRPLRDPRQQQLQADRPVAGLFRLFVAAQSAAARRFRLGLSSLRPSRAARGASQLRLRDEAVGHAFRLTRLRTPHSISRGRRARPRPGSL